jgi:hypothetical protein
MKAGGGGRERFAIEALACCGPGAGGVRGALAARRGGVAVDLVDLVNGSVSWCQIVGMVAGLSADCGAPAN